MDITNDINQCKERLEQCRKKQKQKKDENKGAKDRLKYQRYNKKRKATSKEQSVKRRLLQKPHPSNNRDENNVGKGFCFKNALACEQEEDNAEVEEEGKKMEFYNIDDGCEYVTDASECKELTESNFIIVPDLCYTRHIKGTKVIVEDVLSCNLPTRKDTVEAFVDEIISRVTTCLNRNQTDDILLIVDRAIACISMIINFEGFEYYGRKDMLAKLYSCRYSVLNMHGTDFVEQWNALLLIRKYSEDDRELLSIVSDAKKVMGIERTLRYNSVCHPRRVKNEVEKEKERRRSIKKLIDRITSDSNISESTKKTKMKKLYAETSLSKMCGLFRNYHMKRLPLNVYEVKTFLSDIMTGVSAFLDQCYNGDKLFCIDDTVARKLLSNIDCCVVSVVLCVVFYTKQNYFYSFDYCKIALSNLFEYRYFLLCCIGYCDADVLNALMFVRHFSSDINRVTEIMKSCGFLDGEEIVSINMTLEEKVSESEHLKLPSCIMKKLDTEIAKYKEGGSLDAYDFDYCSKEDISFILNTSFGCENCMRQKCARIRGSSVHSFDLYHVKPDGVISIKSALNHVKKRDSRLKGKDLLLCSECMMFLDKSVDGKKNQEWEYCWPSFLWNTLTKSDVVTDKLFVETYDAKLLWKYIPDTVRIYWREIIVDESSRCQSLKYSRFVGKANEPKSFFVDGTSELQKFMDNIHSYNLKNTLQALDPERMCRQHDKPPTYTMLPKVLCPWGCSEFLFRTKPMDASLLMQNNLPKVQLNLTKKSSNKFHLIDSSRRDYFRHDDEEVDLVLMNENWPILPTVRFIEGKGLSVCTCRHHSKASTQKRLYTHLPRKRNILSSTQPDDICCAVLQQRYAKPVTKGTFNTKPISFMQKSSFCGIDSANVVISSDRDIQCKGPVMTLHRCEALHRDDINAVCHSMIKENILHENLFDEMIMTKNEIFNEYMTLLLARSASFVPVLNAIVLQQATSNGQKIKVEVLKRKRNSNEKEKRILILSRNWDAIIYNSQVNDPFERYGCRIKHVSSWRIPKGKIDEYELCRFSLVTNVLLGCVSSCKELYYAIDSKEIHSCDDFSGYLLTYIHSNMMKHSDTITIKNSPFNGAKIVDVLKSVVKSYSELSLTKSIGLDKKRENFYEDYFAFNANYISDLLPTVKYPRIHVCESIEEDTLESNKGIDIFIMVGKKCPIGEAGFKTDHGTYEARVVISVSVSDPNSFNILRYARHGNGYSGWWVQRSKSLIMTQVDRSDIAEGSDPYPNLPRHQFMYLCVYVRKENATIRDYKNDLYKSVGGQDYLYCSCSGEENAFIATGTTRIEQKLCCSMPECKLKEKYTCQFCNYKICHKCYLESTTKDGVRFKTTLSPCGEMKETTFSETKDEDNTTEIYQNECDDNNSKEVGMIFEGENEELTNVFDDADNFVRELCCTFLCL
jgi:hypothetical protein